MEDQLTRVPHAEQVQVAQDDHAKQSEGLRLFQRRVEQVEVALKHTADKRQEKCHNVPYTFIVILECVLYEVHTADYIQRRTHNVEDQGEDAWRRHWLKPHILTRSRILLHMPVCDAIGELHLIQVDHL